MRRGISRRDVLKLTWEGFRVLPLLPVSGFLSYEPQPSLSPNGLPLGIKTPDTHLQRPVPKRINVPSDTTEEWRQPTEAEAAAWLSNPDFFTEPKPEVGRVLHTNQFDESEYMDFDFSEYTDDQKDNYLRNTCGLAIFSTILKTYNYLKYGTVPEDILIENIRQQLWDQTFVDNQGYQSTLIQNQDGPLLMSYAALKPALELLDPYNELYTVEELTPNYGARYARLVPEYEWPKLFERANEITSAGGMILIFGLLYDWGHFSLMTDVQKSPYDLALFHNTRTNAPYRNTLGNYHQTWEGQPGFMYALAIKPTFIKSPGRAPIQDRVIPI